MLGFMTGFEMKHNVSVLLAVEQGSRAWGLDAPGSDYDIRFIYRDNPARAFSIFKQPQVIEEHLKTTIQGKEVEVEFTGWSLHKALNLAVSSNPQIGEFLSAKVNHASDRQFRSDLSEIFSEASPRVITHAYRGTTKKNIMGKDVEISIKNVLQSVRSALACHWILQNPTAGQFPPIDLTELRNSIDINGIPLLSHDAENTIDELVSLKRRGITEQSVDMRNLIESLRSSLDQIEQNVMCLPDTHIEPELAERAFRNQYPDIFEVEDMLESNLTAEP